MLNLSHKYTLLIISIASPILIGVYKDDKLIDSISNEKKTSEVLLPMIMGFMKAYNISRIIYARGPGSYMAIKLTYIMIQTIKIVQGIPCFGCSGFSLNSCKPIKAIGNLYFIKEKETIMTKKFEHTVKTTFALPQNIHDLEIDEESTPEYCLPAV